MPLHIDAIPTAVTKGNLLRWILDTDEVRKQHVGSIEIRGRTAIVEVPEAAGPRLARRLDGQRLVGRAVQVWYAGEAVDDEGSRHFHKLARWLEMEERAESEQAAEWRSAVGGDDSSTTLTNLVARGEEAGLGGYALLTLGRRNPMQVLPATQIAVGSPVRLSEPAAQSGVAQKGVVTRVEAREIEVALKRPFRAEAESPALRLDLSEDETTVERSRAALAKARYARGDRLGELRDVCLGLREPQFDEPPGLDPFDPGLDASQRSAIAFALSARDVAVIHGPPGTGKTTTLVELIRQVVRNGGKVLACAPSNLGVDNLFERLLDRREKAVRLGHAARVLPHLREQTLSALVPRHRDVRRVKKLRVEATELFRKADKPSRAGSDREGRSALRDEAKALLADARAIEAAIVQEILDGASVVCATNAGLDPELLGPRRFDLVVIDEACQCVEPACWIPLLRANRAVLAGDHCQLPPTIVSMEAAGEGFNVSLQERLVELYGERISRPLLVQYRMHEEIMRFSSTEFYQSRLQAHSSVAGHRLCDLPGVNEDELTSRAVRFIDTSGACYDEEKEPSGKSFLNREEAKLAIQKVRDLIERGIPAADIAVITPYAAQVRLIRETLSDLGVEAGSIDGFQGREKEAVILSLVRSNQEKEIGFLGDVRRMNVALTRARRKLIVIGDSSTIAAHPFYARLLDYFGEVDGYHVVWEEE